MYNAVSVTMAMPLFSGKNEDEQEQSTTKGGNSTVHNKLPRTHWGGYSQAGDFLTPRTNYWCITFQGISVLKLRVNMHMSMVWMCIGCGQITSYVELYKPTPRHLNADSLTLWLKVLFWGHSLQATTLQGSWMSMQGKINKKQRPEEKYNSESFGIV